VPDEADNDDVDYGYDQQQHRVCEGVAIQLVNDKEREDNEGDRIIPKPLSQEAHDEPELMTP
jgi:hypothetical protein